MSDNLLERKWYGMGHTLYFCNGCIKLFQKKPARKFLESKRVIYHGLKFFIILISFALLIFFYQFNPRSYYVKHQCDVNDPDDIGDPNCYNYKTRNGELFNVPTSAKIAERSGADMNRFADYHCGDNFRKINGDEYCQSIGRKRLFEQDSI